MDEIKKMRQTTSNISVIGRLKEVKLEIEENTFDDDKTPYQTLKGNFSLSINGHDHEFRLWMNDHFHTKNDNGKHKGNSSFDDFVALMDAPIGTKFKLRGRADRFNDYKSKKNGNVVSIDSITLKSAERVNDDEEELYEGRIEGIIYRIEDEIANEQLSGRKIITFVGIGYNETALPHKLYLEEELVSNFESMYKVGDVCVLDIEVLSKTYGNKAVETSTGFAGGRKAKVSRVSSGFTIEEWSIFNGDAPYGEDMIDKNGQSLYFTMEDVKPLMEKRKIMLEAVKQGDTPSYANNSSTAGLSSRKVAELTDEDIPF